MGYTTIDRRLGLLKAKREHERARSASPPERNCRIGRFVAIEVDLVKENATVAFQFDDPAGLAGWTYLGSESGMVRVLFDRRKGAEPTLMSSWQEVPDIVFEHARALAARAYGQSGEK